MRWMKAATILRPHALEIQRVPCPEPGPGEVLLALEGTGVCASNLPLWQGASWLQYPLKAGNGGHEGWGVIERVGPGVDLSLEGRRVAALSYSAYAEFDVARADQLVELPDTWSHQPFPGEALGCAVNIFRRSDIRPGHTVAIVGIGFLGALLIQLARKAGAKVIGISRRDHALEEAKHMGAHVVLAADPRAHVLEQIAELTRGVLCDRVIEATGKQEPLDMSAELCREGGRLIIAGYHQDGPRTVNMQLWNWRGLDVVNAHERDPSVSVRGMREAVELVRDGTLTPQPLYKDYPLERLGDALDAIARLDEPFMKALIRVGRSS